MLDLQTSFQIDSGNSYNSYTRAAGSSSTLSTPANPLTSPTYNTSYGVDLVSDFPALSFTDSSIRGESPADRLLNAAKFVDARLAPENTVAPESTGLVSVKPPTPLITDREYASALVASLAI